MTLSKPILTITVNPALDVATSLERVVPQRKLRCGPPRYDPGGGGVNVSRAIKELGGDSHAFIALAGSTGQWFRRLLEETGIDSEFWELRGETRFALTVAEEATGQQYRFTLPGPEQDEGEAERLLGALAVRMGKGCRFVVASGSLPPGFPDDFYARLIVRARELGVLLVLDTSGPALKRALVEQPFLIKLNHFEAQELTGSRDVQASAHVLAQDLVQQRAAEIVIITLGEGGAIIATSDMRLHIKAPKAEVVSIVGAGDSFIGAMTLGLANGWSVEDASRYGVAAAASAVTTEATALCERATTQKFFDAMVGTVEREV